MRTQISWVRGCAYGIGFQKWRESYEARTKKEEMVKKQECKKWKFGEWLGAVCCNASFLPVNLLKHYILKMQQNCQ